MEVQEQFGEDVRIIGVPGLSDVTSMEEFIARHGIESVPQLNDNGELWERFGVLEQRTYVFVNDDGSTEITGYGSLAADVEDLIAR